METSSQISCPECGVRGKRVKTITLRSVLRPERVAEIGDQDYLFCATPDCGTVYFAGDRGRTFSKEDLTVRVGIKEATPPRPVCYCFGHTVEEIFDEVERTGRSTVEADIRKRIAVEGCSCETQNPQGACCLGTVESVVRAAYARFGVEESAPENKDKDKGCCGPGSFRNGDPKTRMFEISEERRVAMAGFMERIGESVKGRVAAAKLDPVENEIRKHILLEFARIGKAPDSFRIMERMGLASEEIVKRAAGKLEEADILMRQGGEIVSAYPFSAQQTRHRVLFADGRQVYALCATDALGIHFMLLEETTILSRCPWCEGEAKVVVGQGRIVYRNPEGMVEFVGEQDRCGCTAETCCPYINLFCSGEHLAKWKVKNPEFANGETYSLDEALQHGRMIFENFLK